MSTASIVPYALAGDRRDRPPRWKVYTTGPGGEPEPGTAHPRGGLGAGRVQREGVVADISADIVTAVRHFSAHLYALPAHPISLGAVRKELRNKGTGVLLGRTENPRVAGSIPACATIEGQSHKAYRERRREMNPAAFAGACQGSAESGQDARRRTSGTMDRASAVLARTGGGPALFSRLPTPLQLVGAVRCGQKRHRLRLSPRQERGHRSARQ